MAVATIASGLFNAVAFSGASFIFSKFNNSGYTAEMKRHNLEMEKFTKERDEWNEARLHESDRVTKLHFDQRVAEQDREETLNDFEVYARKVEREQHIHDVKGVEHIFEKKKPVFHYTPSKEMTNYMTLVKYIMAGAISSGLVFLL